VRTEIGYDRYFTQGQLDRTHNPDGLITKTLTYDPSGNLLTEQDDAENVTTYTYDNLGRRTKVTFADLTAEQVVYRSDDLPEFFTALDEFGQGLFEIYSYCNAGKQKTSEVIGLPGGSPLSGLYQKDFAYDGLGRVLEAKAYSKDPSDPQRELLAVTTRSYDSIDNVLSELQRIKEDRGQGFTQIHSADHSMTFDDLKNRLTVASSLGGYSASYDFDALSRIEHIGYLATYERREYMGAAGRLFAKHCGNNTTTELGALGYDSLRRPIKIVHKRNDQPHPTTLADFCYDYDINNNRLSEAKQHYTGQDQAYTYDEVNRLIRFDEGFLVGNVIPNPIDTEVYGLDGVGNRKEHEKNGQVFTNTVDSMNRYAASYNGSLILDYDPRGNTTKYGDLDLTYDVYGKVVGIDEPAMTAVYLYDASDRRVMAQVNGYATYFLLEGNRVLQEVDGNYAQVTKEYVWGSAIDELVILQLDGEIYHAHADALGSTTLLTDATGDIVERYDYNPFGACVATDINGGGLVGNPYHFTGRRLDSETGLYYYRARHYSSEKDCHM